MYYEEHDFEIVDRVVQVSARMGVSPPQVALAWLMHKPGVVAPIIGARKAHHLEEAVAAVDTKLSAEDMAFLEEPYQAHSILGHS
jgi:aryl-alcohol dehydrogenase (NADP+)